MALLSLKDIGKIYVSEGNVAVGIRGVNLSFEKGEFVAVTGKSGSGKSTLLNVISGMDSYEEGELYIEGQSTSHYLQLDWEEYREKYISFIFQDYNIIESFTVLQNVELALMHIDNKKERRKKALDLISRVGLTSHINHKGSKLSGGQKQRTVIARALAKDSPIILADEPTGNLDSVTSKEIIDLLYEVSKDKLLIVVTHNFEEVEERATRHIRIFDGAVESDHIISENRLENEEEKSRANIKKQTLKEKIKNDAKNGITLGSAIFLSKPKLSFFLCMLMIVGTLGIFFMTASSGDAAYIFEKQYMFNNIDGRLVITKQDGAVITDSELDELAESLGANNVLHYDVLLDSGSQSKFWYESGGKVVTGKFNCTYGEDFGDNIVGRYPKKDNEVLLYLPISYQPAFGKGDITTDKVYFANMELEVVGVKYYYDNNITPKCLFTYEGFRVATAAYYLIEKASVNVMVTVDDGKQWSYSEISPSFSINKNRIYVGDSDYISYVGRFDTMPGVSVSIITSPGYDFDFDDMDMENIFQSILGNMTGGDQYKAFMKTFTGGHITDENPGVVILGKKGHSEPNVVICPYMMTDFVEESLESSYIQASLFFENNEQAYAAVDKLGDMGYIAVPADTTYIPDALSTILYMLTAIMTAIMWVLSIVFFSFVINLCSGKTIDAFKSDMAIMRSMGIPVRVIRIGMYVRMFIALIPAFALVVAAAVMVFTVPKFNAMFTYLYWWQYLAIFIGMIILTFRTTHKQIKRLFGESVKKAVTNSGR